MRRAVLALLVVAGCRGGDAGVHDDRGAVAPDDDTLGSAFEHGTGVGKDIARAVGLYDRACGHGSARACWSLGRLYADGAELPRDESRAATLFARACGGGEAAACGDRAAIYTRHDDYALAVPLLERGCTGNDGPSCANLAYLFDNALGVTADAPKATVLRARACALGVTKECP